MGNVRRPRLVMASVLAGVSFIFVLVLIMFLVVSAQRRAGTTVNSYPGTTGAQAPLIASASSSQHRHVVPRSR